ncbi:MAG TPA: aldolase/citrate lyase family protein [Chloroflexota bacterium]|nr:aldolase/citrate lyase family protein [Chloroflexota bacterium]
MAMKSNPMKAALAAGRVQLGTWINLVRNPAVLTLLKATGLDYARVDMEHSSPSIETVADMAVLARALDFPLVVRPPEGSREWITRLLDVGVWGLHVPQVDTPHIAQRVVEAVRYAPAGMRGMSGLGPHNDFAPTSDPAADRAMLNEQVHLTVMLESAQAYRHLDEIVALPGVDAVTLGPSDLAQELGVLGTPDQGRVIDEYRQRVIEAAARHGKDVAMLVQTLEEAERWIAAGAKLIAYASDVAVLHSGFAAAVRRLRPAP